MFIAKQRISSPRRRAANGGQLRQIANPRLLNTVLHVAASNALIVCLSAQNSASRAFGPEAREGALRASRPGDRDA
jgi:hypothetical protein